MKIKEQTVYHCGYCSKYYIRKHHAARHEKYCKNNPNNKHQCFKGCKHLKKTLEDGVTMFECEAKKEYMYSYKAEKSHLYMQCNCDLLTSLNATRMPLECVKYDPISNQEHEEYYWDLDALGF